MQAAINQRNRHRSAPEGANTYVLRSGVSKYSAYVLVAISHPSTIPRLIQMSVKDTSMPRTSGGASSVMYTGAITMAHPTPTPVTTRPRSKGRKDALALMIAAPTMNTTQATAMVGLRPRRSAVFPAKRAPKAATRLRAPTMSSCVVCIVVFRRILR